jgi:hypothetical protein
MTKESYLKIEKYFWWIFIWLPLVTGMVRYNWLSVEPYVSQTQQTIVARSLDPASKGIGIDEPVMRKLKGMEKSTNKEDFIHDRFLEVLRYGVFSFLYGLLGCTFYAYGQFIKEKEPSFIAAFRKSLIIAILFPVFFLACTL